jgi:hypothetical protein
MTPPFAARSNEIYRRQTCGCLGNTVLLAVVSLLEAALDGDDPIWARHLELQVGVVGDGHELGEAWLAEESMVNTGEVHHLKGEHLLPKVIRLAEGDIELDAPEGHNFLSRDNPVERHLAEAQATP